MSFTNFPNGITSLGVPIFGGGIAPTFGNVFYLVTAKTDADPYYNLMKNLLPDANIFSTLSSAYTNMTSSQGDTLIVMPGDHVQTESLTWAKHDTRITGWGSPNQIYQPGTLTTGAVRISTATSAVSEILNVTGHYVQLQNFGTYNSYSGATNYGDVRIVGRNAYLHRMSLRGGNGATQLATDGAGVPLIVDTTTSGAGNGLLVENSTIGSSGNGVRSKGPGCLEFLGPGVSAGFGTHFVNCTFSARVEIATANNVGMVSLTGQAAADRELLFDNCFFYNFVQGLGTGPTYVIRDAVTTTHQIIIKNCTANKGFTAWTDATTYLSNSSTLGGAAYGIGLNS